MTPTGLLSQEALSGLACASEVDPTLRSNDALGLKAKSEAMILAIVFGHRFDRYSFCYGDILMEALCDWRPRGRSTDTCYNILCRHITLPLSQAAESTSNAFTMVRCKFAELIS